MLAVLTDRDEILFVKDDDLKFVSLPTTAGSGREHSVPFVKFVPKNGPHRGRLHYVPLARVAAITDEPQPGRRMSRLGARMAEAVIEERKTS